MMLGCVAALKRCTLPFPSTQRLHTPVLFRTPSLPKRGRGKSTTICIRDPPDARCSRKTMSTTASEATEGATPAAADQREADVLVQYVVLRRDLIDSWPLGSVVTQGCHASVAAIWSHRDHPDTAAYLSDSNLNSMHKVTLEVKGEAQMRNLAEKLAAGGIDHKVWVEQPEDIPTCVATRPYPKSQVTSFFKKLKLCK